MPEYRITITGATPTDKAEIRFDCTIEVETSPGVWAPIEAGPAAIAIPSSEIIGIVSSGATDQEKRDELLRTLRQHARSLEVLIGNAAIAALEDLLPAGWPVTVNL